MQNAVPTDDERIAHGSDELAVARSVGITELSHRPAAEQVAAFKESGVGAVRGLLRPEEVSEIREVFQAAGDRGPIDGLADPSMLDPQRAGRDAMLRRFPRMIHPHRYPDERFGQLALQWMLSDRIGHVLRRLMGEEPIAAQSMFYFKGPGAKGQSLHQDNLFLDVQPGTCIAAWIAVDDCDDENGCMVVVPGTGTWRIVCEGRVETEETADEFFDRSSLPLPDGCEPVPAPLNTGDVLFFNGSIVHGSYRNRSPHRFRRSLIFHYAPTSCDKISAFYHPLLAMDGSTIERHVSPKGGPCGVGA